MDWLTQTQTVPTWTVIVGTTMTIASILVVVRSVFRASGPDRPSVGTPVEEEPEEEEGFTVIAKFRDGSETRWRKIESWECGSSSGEVTLYRDGEIIAVLPYENLIWAADEKFEFEAKAAA